MKYPELFAILIVGCVCIALKVEQFKQLEQQLLTEQQQHRELAESSEVLERKLVDCQQTVAHLQDEIKTRDDALAEVRMNKEENKKQLKAFRAELEAQQSQASKDLEAANQTVRTLEVEIGNRDTSMQNMHRDIEYKAEKLSEVIASSSQSQQLIDDLECKLSARDEEMQRLKSELETSNQELQQTRAEIEKFHDAGVTVDLYQQLQEQNKILQSSVTDLRGEMGNLVTSLDQSQTECQQLRDNLHLTSSSDTEQKATIVSLEAELMEINTQAQEEISQWKEKASSFSDELKSCVAELEQLKECQRITAEEKESLQSALTDKDAKLRTVNLQLEASEESVHQVRMELEAAASAHQMTTGQLQRQIEESELRVKEVDELLQVRDSLVTDMNAELESVRKQLEDVTKQEAEQQQMFVDRETLLSNTIATLHQQLEQSAADIESLNVKCSEQASEVLVLVKKLDDRDIKIASLSENFREEELQLVALTEELEACKSQAAKDEVSAETEWQKIVDSKDAQLAALTESARNQEMQMKKYVAVIKKLKQQLHEERVKREDLEKQSSSTLDESGASAADEEPSGTNEPDKPADHVVPIQQSAEHTVVVSSETCPKPSDMEAEQQILREMNKKLQCEISELESKCREYVTSATTMNDIVSGLKEENKTLKADVENMSVEMRKASDISYAHIQEMSTELSHWKSIASDVEQTRKEVARLELEKSDAVAKVEAVMAEITKLKSDLEARSADVERLSTQLSDEIAEKESVKHELNCSHDIHAKIQSEYTNITEDRTRLEHQLAVTQDTLQQLADDNEQLRVSCETLKKELQTLRTEAEAAKVMEMADTDRAEYEEKEKVIKNVQVEVDKLQQATAVGNWKSMEEYSVLETENLCLTEQCNSLVKRLEEYQIKYETCVKSATEKEGRLVEESERLLQKLKLAEESNTVLELRLKEVECDHAKNVDLIKQIQNELEAEKTRRETEVNRLTDMVLKSEGTVQQLVAELGAEREEFSLRESELEGSSEELQLEVARLAHKVETDVEMQESLRSRNMEIEMQLKSLVSDKDSVERERNEYCEQSRKLAEENEFWKAECDQLRQEKEQLVSEFQLNQDVAERKYVALSGQYDMLSVDINNYQELVESLRSRNSQLEQQLLKTLDDEAAQMALSRDMEMERKMMENERRARSEELGSVRLRESELLSEIKRLQLQIEDYSNTDEELVDSRSHILALQTENDSLRKNVVELEQKVQELGIVEEEQSALQERYLSVLQDNSALIKQSKEMYQKLWSFKELAENSGDQSAAEVAALRAEVETLRSERELENSSQRNDECEQLRAELLALKAFTQQQTSELQALRASASQQSFDDRSENNERVHRESTKTSEHCHTAEHQPELMLNNEAARVHVVPLHSSAPHKPTSDDRISEISHLKAQVNTLPDR